jgi:Tfp pilus assembly PilM family ATPase
LGISFYSNRICFVELFKEADIISLNNAESVEVELSFEDDLSKMKSNQKALTNISGEIYKYISKRNYSYDKTAVTIGTSQAFLNILPLDYSEGKQALNSKIYWELSNFFPDTYNDYIINTYRLNSVMPCINTDEFLIIAVLKNAMEFVKRLFKLCNLNLDLVDIDHFSAEHALRFNYNEAISKRNILLVGLRSGRIDYGYIENKKYKYYCYSKYSSGPEFNLSLVRKVNSLMNGILLKQAPDTIYLYGDIIRDDTLESLIKNTRVRVEILNPFENINSSAMYLKNENLRKISYQYTPAAGAALRILTSQVENNIRQVQKQEN